LVELTGVTFLLYKDQQGGAPLWLETQNVTPDKYGRYTVTLGVTTSEGLPMDVFGSGEARWLGVQAERQSEQPRVLLVSVPYALKAADAQTLGGLPVNAFALARTSSGAETSPGSTTSIVASVPPVVTTASIAGTGTTDFLPLWTNSTTLGSSILFQAPSSNSIGIGTTAPTAKLDVNGGATIRGQLSLPFTGTATSTLAFPSQPLDLLASAFNSSTHSAVPQNFRWQAEPTGNNSASPSGKLNLLFATSTGTPAETGLSISNTGIITFATGQTLPTVTGNETVKGNFTATGSVSGGSAHFTGNVTMGNETVNGNINATGSLTAGLASFTGNNGAEVVLVDQKGAGEGLLAVATTGSGVIGSGGTGVTGSGTTGLSGISTSASGVAGLFNNKLGGIILQGQSKGATVFTVNGPGNVITAGSISANNGTVSASSGTFSSALTNAGTSTLGGPVAIGRVTPSAQLDVHDFASAAAVDTLIGNPGCGTSFAGIGFLPGGIGFNACTNYSLLGDGTNTFINAGPFGALHFRLSNGDAMIVNNNARVGIGTTTPVAKLDVNGDANITGVITTRNLAVQSFANNTVTSPCPCPAGFNCLPDPPNSACDIPGMKLSETTATSPVLVMANVNGVLTADCVNAVFVLAVDGVEVARSFVSNGSNGSGNTQSGSAILMALTTPAPGSHTFELQEGDDEHACHEGGGTPTNLSLANSSRVLIVREW